MTQEKDESYQLVANQYLAEAYLVQGSFNEACELARRHPVGAKLPADKLIICGDKLVERGDYSNAYNAYCCANAQDKLLALGDLIVEKSPTDYNILSIIVFGCYERSKPRERLNALGNLFLQKQDSDLRDAVRAFGLAKNHEALLKVAKLAVKRRLYKRACECYCIVGDVEKLLTFGKLCVEKKELPIAIEVFEKCHAVDALRHCAMLMLDDSIGNNFPHQALEILKKYGADFPEAKLAAFMAAQINSKVASHYLSETARRIVQARAEWRGEPTTAEVSSVLKSA